MQQARSTMWILAACALAPANALGQEGAAEPAATGAAECEIVTPDDDVDPFEPDDSHGPRIHDYAVSFGVDALRFRIADGTRMGMTGPSIGVDYLVGHAWGFALRGAFTFPVVGRERQEGGSSETFALRDIYQNQRGSYDVMVGFYRRLELTPKLKLVLAAGAHARLLGLTDPQYQPVQIIQGGLSGFARVDYTLSEHFFVGGEFYAGLDPIDFINHHERAVFAAPMTLSVVAGARR